MKETGGGASLLAKDLCTLASLDAALRELAMTAPKVKGPIVAACAACIAADGTVTVREGELLRAITSTLGCPMPPIGGGR
jgi:tellurite resistance protein